MEITTLENKLFLKYKYFQKFDLYQKLFLESYLDWKERAINSLSF